MKNVAVILAGGVGSRMGGPLPKQFLACQGRLLIEYAVDAFDRHPLVDEVAVVIPIIRTTWKKWSAATGG